ncbi:MAG: hypothetical protein PHO70_05210 [Candidatus Omnitrophica bacterium]|nr:hypothetical protein [Candidatus Omnitrophota bacterium]
MEKDVNKLKVRFASLFFLAVLFAYPSFACANAGTALLWLGVGHLLLGNTLIGVIEGKILVRYFGTKTMRSILIMILANYFSMIIGVIGIIFSQGIVDNFVSINNVFCMLVFILLFSYVLTIFIEWPFCFWIMKEKTDRDRLSFKASIVLQTISYGIFIPIYLSVSGVSLITKTKVDKPAFFLKSNNAWVYYVSSDCDGLYRIRADGSSKEKVKEFMLKDELGATLYICNKGGKGKLSINWFEYNKKSELYYDYSRVLLDDINGMTAANEPCSSDIGPYSREPIDFRAENERDWYVYAGSWAIEGLRADNIHTGKSLRIALETPFLMWPVTKVTVLPNDQVICQLGDNQIILFDLNTFQIGLITFGKSPVVILENSLNEK